MVDVRIEGELLEFSEPRSQGVIIPAVYTDVEQFEGPAELENVGQFAALAPTSVGCYGRFDRESLYLAPELFVDVVEVVQENTPFDLPDFVARGLPVGSHQAESRGCLYDNGLLRNNRVESHICESWTVTPFEPIKPEPQIGEDDAPENTFRYNCTLQAELNIKVNGEGKILGFAKASGEATTTFRVVAGSEISHRFFLRPTGPDGENRVWVRSVRTNHRGR